jgi:transposase
MLKGGKRIYLACGVTDLRKSINALSVLVQESFKLNPFDDTMFVFCNRDRDIIKILEWDGDGFWLHIKKLEKGRFQWPNTDGGDKMGLTYSELEILIGGTRLVSKFKRHDIFNLRQGVNKHKSIAANKIKV